MVPVKYFRNFQGVCFAVVAVAFTITEKTLGAIDQLLLKLVADKGFRAQRRATDGGAIDRKVNAGVFEVWVAADKCVLYFIKGSFLPEQGKKALVPRAGEKGANIADRIRAPGFSQN